MEEERMSQRSDKPFITIITATFNAKQHLSQTIQSIRQQSYDNLEWIIIDGASSDGTVEMIGQNEDIIDYWRSEPDKGIYDAFNKGIKQAKGEWLCFLGAGDMFHTSNVLCRIGDYLKNVPSHVQLVYGDVRFVSPGVRKELVLAGGDWKLMKNTWEGFRPFVPPHPGTFHKKSLFDNENQFDTSYNIVADTKLLLVAQSKNDPAYVPIVIADATYGGVSTDPRHAYRLWRELMRCNEELGIVPPFLRFLYYSFKLLRGYLLRKVLPAKAFAVLADIYRLATGRGRKWTLS